MIVVEGLITTQSDCVGIYGAGFESRGNSRVGQADNYILDCFSDFKKFLERNIISGSFCMRNRESFQAHLV